MARWLVEEIDKRTYNPKVYYTSADPQSRSYRAKNKIGKDVNTSQFRSVKRVNYSLADMEAKLYTPKTDENEKTDESVVFKSSTREALEKFSPQQIMQSKRRFMELDTENIHGLSEVPNLLSSITGMNKDKIDSNTKTISGNDAESTSRGNKGRFDIPDTVQVSYRSTKIPKQKKKSTNRSVALKKILTTKRSLNTYFDTIGQAERSMVLQNVYNKKYFKVLPLISICSICGGIDGISGCVKCEDKVCSLKCYNLHNETRCVHR